MEAIDINKLASEIAGQLKEKKSSRTFKQLCKVFIESRKESNIKKITIDQYKQVFSLIDQFNMRHGLIKDVEEFDYSWYKRYKKYMLDNREYALNTFAKHIKKLKTLLTWGVTMGFVQNTIYRTYKVTWEFTNDEPLTPAELTKIADFEISFKEFVEQLHVHWDLDNAFDLDQKQQQQRYRSFLKCKDYFVAMCSSGMYPNDLRNYNKGLIDSSADGNRYVKYERHKDTGAINKSYGTFLYEDRGCFRFQSIAEKYNHEFKWVKWWSRDLRLLRRIIGINKALKPRLGRKTFASILYYHLDTPLAIVSKALGHGYEHTTRHYLGIKNNEVAAALKEQAVQKGLTTVYTGDPKSLRDGFLAYIHDCKGRSVNPSMADFSRYVGLSKGTL